MGRVADYWVKTDDDESFSMGRCILRHEGLLIGGSCGATVAGALRFIKENKIGAGKRVGVLLADSSRNYMSKLLDDSWLEQNGFNLEDVNRSVNEKGFYAERMDSESPVVLPPHCFNVAPFCALRKGFFCFC